MTRKLSIALIMLVGMGTATACAENFALGKHYEMSKAPNYGRCSDSGDATQLTDGKALGCDWVKQSTVGWVFCPQVTVTIDLGKIQTIGKVCFNSSGQEGNVYLPAATAVMISEDGINFKLATMVGTGMFKQGPQKIETADLMVPGRYVRLVFQTTGKYLFLDEVEIFSPENKSAKPVKLKSVTPEQLAEMFKTSCNAIWVIDEWKAFRDSIKKQDGQKVTAKIKDIDSRLRQLDVSDADALSNLRDEYLALWAETARPGFESDLVFQTVGPWSDLRGSWHPKPRSKPEPATSISLWQDEYESCAYAITNLGSESKRLLVNIPELTDESGKAVSLKGHIRLRRAYPVQTDHGWRALDALPLLATGDKTQAEITLAPGESFVLWLTVSSRGLQAGKYQTTMQIFEGDSKKPAIVQSINLAVAPLKMLAVADRAMKGYQWEYLVGWGVPASGLADLKSHGVNVFYLHPEALPMPVFNADRTKLESVDFQKLDNALERRQKPELHAVFWGTEWHDLIKFDKPGDEELFKQYIRAWQKHLEDKGYGPDKYYFYPYDECIPDKFITMARLIKEVDPRLQVFTNFTGAPQKTLEAIAPYIDFWCPLASDFPGYGGHREMSKSKYDAFCALRKKYNFTLWTYDCNGPGQTLSPDTYYRRISWCAFNQGATGAGFWVYAPTINPWYRNDSKESYALIYYAKDAPSDITRAEEIIPSRRWEAVREGSEDFEYLYQLQKTINEAQNAGVNKAPITRAEQTLKTVVNDVLTKTSDQGRYDQARKTVTQQILKLRSQLVKTK